MADTEKLINEMEKSPILYNYSDKNFKNKGMKDATWKEIGKNLGLNGEFISYPFGYGLLMTFDLRCCS